MIFGSAELTAAFFLLIFVVCMIGFLVYEHTRKRGRNLRDIPAFSALVHAIGLAVEAGHRLHVSLGTGDMTGEQSAAGLAGLSILERVARTASVSDSPPITTSGDGALSILSRDVLKSVYRDLDAAEFFRAEQARLVGLTPFSFAAAAMPVIYDEGISASLLTGHFGAEIGLISEAAARKDGFTLAGSDSLVGQAVLLAAAEEPLIGEELFAGGAYLRAGKMHTASLRAQDVMRWLVIAVLLLSGLAKLIG